MDEYLNVSESCFYFNGKSILKIEGRKIKINKCNMNFDDATINHRNNVEILQLNPLVVARAHFSEKFLFIKTFTNHRLSSESF